MHEAPLPEREDPEQQHIAFEVEDYTMPPALPGWLLVFRRAEAAPETLLDTLCLARLADGRQLFRRLRKGREPDRYDLEDWDGSNRIEDVEVVSALPFAALTPGRWGR